MKNKECPKCCGSGKLPELKERECDLCEGNGNVWVGVPDPQVIPYTPYPAPPFIVECQHTVEF